MDHIHENSHICKALLQFLLVEDQNLISKTENSLLRDVLLALIIHPKQSVQAKALAVISRLKDHTLISFSELTEKMGLFGSLTNRTIEILQVFVGLAISVEDNKKVMFFFFDLFFSPKVFFFR
jgi:hypothetical protein